MVTGVLIGSAVAVIIVIFWYVYNLEDPEVRLYPPEALSDNQIKNKSYGNGLYLTTASTNNYSNAFKAVGYTIESHGNRHWDAESGQGSYADDGSYKGNTNYFADPTQKLTVGEPLAGEWFKIKMPYKIRLSHMKLLGHQGGARWTAVTARNYKVYGSNNDRSWVELYDSKNELRHWGEPIEVPVQKYYQYYLFVCNSIRAGHYVTYGWQLAWSIYAREKKYF